MNEGESTDYANLKFNAYKEDLAQMKSWARKSSNQDG